MKKKILLPIIFLALGALVGCGGNQDPESTPTSSEDPVTSETESEAPSHTYTWEISNEAALTAEWHVGDADRQIEITSDPAVNLTTLLTREEAFLSSSDAAVVGVQGSYLKALSAGTATITLEFDNQTDSVEIEVLPLVENITTIAEAFELSTGPDNVDQPDVTLKAVVTHILGTAAMIADGTGYMYVYDSGFAAGVKVGDYVKVTGEINQYQQYTPQLKSVGTNFEILTETAPVIDLTPTTLTAAQWDTYFTGESYTEYVEGYATVFKDGSYINFYYHETLGGAKAELPGSVRGYANGANFCADACVSGVYKFKGYLYGTSCEVDGTTGDVTLYRQNLYAAEYEEVKAPSVSIPEPKTITVTTLAEAINNPAEELKQKFHIDGVTVSKLGQKAEDTTAGIYGNIWLTDGTTDPILSYGATATATALSWGEAAGAYSYANPKDFDTNDLTKGIVVGDKLNIDFVVTSFKGTKQLNTIITAVNADPDTPAGGEPAPIAVTTLAEAINNPAAEKSVKFTMSDVTVSKLGRLETDTTAGIYGNIWLTDGTTDPILSYGATATASALTWDDAAGAYSYKNPTDFETNDLTKGIVVGDKLDITFIVTSFKGTKQLNTIITAVNAEGGDVGGGDEGGDTPVEPQTMTIAEALAAADNTQVIVRGIVKNIGTPWSDEYGNICVTITDEKFDELYIYRMNTKVAVGDDITVTGTMATYNSARQIAQGSTAVINSSGNEVPTPTGIVLDIFASTGTYDATAKEISWSKDGVTFVNRKTSNSSDIRTSDADHFRMYQGSTFEVTADAGVSFKTVTIVCTSASYAEVLKGSVDATSGTVTVNGTRVIISVTGTSVTGTLTAQSRINSVVVA